MIEQLDLNLKKDCIQAVLDEYFEDRVARYSWGDCYLLRNHPMLLGLIAQLFLTEVHNIGIGLAGDQGAVMTSIHLYNAAHQSGQMPKSLG